VNGVSLQREPLRIIGGPAPKKSEVVVGPRIGITQAIDWPLRFYLKDSPWVSR
jgi:DNA-3-methyladenine glycosylase